jgi:hypothetical protein
LNERNPAAAMKKILALVFVVLSANCCLAQQQSGGGPNGTSSNTASAPTPRASAGNANSPSFSVPRSPRMNTLDTQNGIICDPYPFPFETLSPEPSC